MPDIFGRTEPDPESPPVIPLPPPVGVPSPGLTRVKLSVLAGLGEKAVGRTVLQIGDGPQLRLIQRVVVALDAADMVPTVTVTFVPGSVEVEMDADAVVQHGQAPPTDPAGHLTLSGQVVVQGPPPAAGPGATPLDPIEVTPADLRRLADEAPTIPAAEWASRIRALQAAARVRAAAAPVDDAVRRAVEAAGEVPPAL